MAAWPPNSGRARTSVAKAKPERRSGGMRQYVGMAVAGTLLLAAGFGLYWVLGMGRGTDGDAPVLQADATPVKQTPPPTASTTNQQGSVVFNELDGKSAAAATADEQLVSRDDTAETSVADVARTVGEGDDAASESELANRKVRTVTVRPGWHDRFGRRGGGRQRGAAGRPAGGAGPAGRRRAAVRVAGGGSRALRPIGLPRRSTTGGTDPAVDPTTPRSRRWRRPARRRPSIPASWRRSRWRAQPDRSVAGRRLEPAGCGDAAGRSRLTCG
jgi:flagellar basal body-associated protein FliL